MPVKRIAFVAMLVVLGVSGAASLFGQQTSKPLTNADVIQMVKSKLPESVIVQAIQSHPGKFNTSPQALIALQKAGVTAAEMNAMMGQAGAAASPASAPASKAEPVNAGPPPSKSRMPKVYLTQGGASQELPLEKTQLAETKTKPSSMKSLAGDSVVAQAMQAGVNTVAMDTAMHMNSAIGGQTVQQAGGIFSGIMAHRKPTVTYVWGVPGPASANVLNTGSPSFSVDFSRVLGVNPDDFAPVIVKLTPAQNTCRIVGATQGKEDASSSPAADWQIYSHFLEERVASSPQKLERGKYKLSPSSELAAGEYAIVLRPVSKDKNFAGGDVARGQGDGLMFDALWTFQVAEDAQ